LLVAVQKQRRAVEHDAVCRATAFELGINFYPRKNVVVGIACCNATELLDAARDVLTEQHSFEEASTKPFCSRQTSGCAS
jgi:hypothetical protein